jgi:hypothetical protein
VLRLIAAQVDRSMQSIAPSAAEKELATTQMRAELRKLVMLADSADLEYRLFRRKAKDSDVATEPRHRKVAQLITRLNQDASLLGRMFDALPNHRDDPEWAELKRAALDSLASCAEALTSATPRDLAPLIRIDKSLAEHRRTSTGADDPATLLAGPLRLLIGDLRALGRLTVAQREPSTQETT